MKYKKWWMPAVFAVISAAVLLSSVFILTRLDGSDSLYGKLSYAMIGAGVWFFLALPIMSLVYSGKVIGDVGKGRFGLTLYNSLLISLPYLVTCIMDIWTMYPLVFFWCEMWAVMGLSEKGKFKSESVWYIPLILFTASAELYMWVEMFYINMCSLENAVWVLTILTYLLNTAAVFIYARVCLKERKHRIPFTLYVSLLMTISVYAYDFCEKTVFSLEGAMNIFVYVLNAVVVFALYEIAALLGAGVKIKLSKKKSEGDEKVDGFDKISNR